MLLNDIKLPKDVAKAHEATAKSEVAKTNSNSEVVVANDESYKDMIEFADNITSLNETKRNYEILISQNNA